MSQTTESPTPLNTEQFARAMALTNALLYHQAKGEDWDRNDLVLTAAYFATFIEHGIGEVRS